MNRNPWSLLCLCLILACKATGGTTRSRELWPGESQLRQGDADAALNELEAAVKRDDQNPELWLLIGEANLDLIDRAIQKGNSNLFINSAIEDAGAALEHSKQSLPGDGRVTALQARLERLRGANDEAYRLATEATQQLKPDLEPAISWTVHRAIAEASFQKFIDLKQANAAQADYAEPYSQTFRALRECEQLRPNDAWVYEKQADLFLWEGARAGAAETLKRGVQTAPQLQSVQGRLIQLYVENGDSETLVNLYRNWVQQKPNEPNTLWFYGLACLRDSDQSRKNQQYAAAVDRLRESKKGFSQSAAIQPEFKDSVDQYLVIVDVSIGWCRYQERQLDAAIQIWIEAAKSLPGAKEIRDGFGRNLKEGISLVGSEYISSKEFERGRTLFKTLSELDPTDSDWMNNYAFLCREAGTAAQAAGRKQDASARFEESYAVYQKAVALMPEDSRTINDCALILLYHLNRDLDLAESMFRKSIELGEKKIASMADSSPEAEPLRSAVGDAYQNLGVLYFEKKKSPIAAKKFFVTSLEISSDPRPEVQWYVNRIDQMEKNLRQVMFWATPFFATLLPANGANGQDVASSPESRAIAEQIQKVNDLIIQGQVNDALDALDEVEKASPNLPETNLLYGRAYLLKADNAVKQGLTGNNVGWSYADAARYLEKATQQMPRNGEAYLLLGRARMASNNVDGAAEAADRAAVLMPKSADAFQLKGEIAFQRFFAAQESKDEDAAKTAYQTALDSLKNATKLAPTSAPAYEKLGDLLLWGNKREEAMDAYATSLGLNPTEALGGRMFKTYDASLWTKIFDKAIDSSKAVRQDNEMPNGMLHWYLGYSHFQMKQLEAAKAEFQKAIAINRDLLSAYYYLGKVLYEKQEFIPAAEAFAQYAAKDAESFARIITEKQDPDPERLKAILNYLEPEAFDKKKPDVAREIAKLNALIEPMKPERWNNYGFLCRETGKFEDSYTAYSKAVELDPENPRLLNDCALILQYHLHRDLDKAKAMLEKAVERADAILKDPNAGPKTKEDARSARQDAMGNLARLKIHPQGEKSE